MVEKAVAKLKCHLRSCIATGDMDIVKKIFSKIKSYCLNSYNFDHLDIILDELFNNEPRFYDLCRPTEDSMGSLVFEFLCEFLEKVISVAKERFLPYYGSMKETLLTVLRLNRSSAKTKELAIKAFQNAVLLPGVSDFGDNERSFISELFGFLQLRLPLTVSSGLIELLGKISFVHKSTFEYLKTDYEKFVVNNLKKELSAENTSSPSILTISGCCEGLSWFYRAYPPNDENQSEFHGNYLKIFSILQMDPGTRFGAVESSLHFLTNHWHNCESDLFQNTKIIYETLNKLCRHQNIKIKRSAHQSMNEFLKTIGSCLAQKLESSLSTTNESPLTAQETTAFRFLIKTFELNIRTNDSANNAKHLEVDIKGLGYLAKACAKLLPRNYLENIYSFTSTYIWNNYRLDKGDEMVRLEFPNDKIYKISEIMSSLTRILEAVFSSNAGSTTCLYDYESKIKVISRLYIILVEFFPRISFHRTFVYRKVFSELVNCLSQHKVLLDMILEDIVYQTVVHSCSFPLPPDYSIVQDFSFNAENALTHQFDEIDSNETVRQFSSISLRDFLPLWNSLLKQDDTDILTSSNVFDTFIVCSLKIIDKLDLSYNSFSNDEGLDVRTDQLSNKTANVPKDFIIFVNLCDLFQFVLNQGNEECMRKWAPLCLTKFVPKCMQFPLVSGFYKLLCSVLKSLAQISYFRSSNNEMDVDDITKERALIQNELQILLPMMIKQLYNFNDELLISCLKLLVNIPMPVWVQLSDDDALFMEAIEHLKLAVHLGCFYQPLGMECLSMLSSWAQESIRPAIDTMLQNVLPHYRHMLTSSVTVITEDDVTQSEQTSSIKKTRSVIKTLRFIQEQERRRLYELNDNELSVPNFRKMQEHLISILGDLGMKHNSFLITTTKIDSTEISWNKLKDALVSYDIPFVDLKPQIRFEQLLPTICHLAVNESRTQVRSLAAELLHSIVIVMIVKSVKNPSQSEREKLIPLWERLFFISLRLATDINKVTRKLFNDLMVQLAFWYSYPHNADSSEAQAFINCLFNVVMWSVTDDSSEKGGNDTSSTNVHRDFAGKLLFFILDSSFSNFNGNASRTLQLFNVNSTLDRIYGSCLHFSPQKRLGAVFLFNSVYPALRRDEDFLKKEVFKIIFHLVRCQELSESDKNTGILCQLQMAFTNIEKTIHTFKFDLNRRDDSIKNPVNWSEPTIEFAIRWLLRFFKSEKTKFRRRSMNLCTGLSKGYLDSNDFFKALFKAKGSDYFVQKFEWTDMFRKSIDDDNEKSFIGMLNASVDCYRWLILKNIVDEERYFLSMNSSFFTAINSFLMRFEIMHSSKQLLKFVFNFLPFLNLILSRYDKFQHFISRYDIITFTVSVAIQPYKLYADSISPKQYSKLLEKVVATVKCFDDSFLDMFFQKASEMLLNYQFSENIETVTDCKGLQLNFSQSEYLFKLLKLISTIFAKKHFLTDEQHEYLFSSTCRYDFNRVNVNPKLILFHSTVLQYLLTIDEKYLQRLLTLLGQDRVSIVFLNHKEAIIESFIEHFELVLLHLNAENWSNLLSIISMMLESCVKNKSVKTAETKIADIFVRNWSHIWPIEIPSLDVEKHRLSLVVDIFLKLMLLDIPNSGATCLTDFFRKLLSHNFPLNIKSNITTLMRKLVSICSFDETLLETLFKEIALFSQNQLPLLSTDLSSKVMEHNFYEDSLRSIIQCFLLPSCPERYQIKILMEILVPIFCRESSHPLDKEFYGNFSDYLNKISDAHNLNLLDAMNSELEKLSNYDQKLCFLQKFYLICIFKSTPENLNQYFIPRFNTIKECLKSDLIKEHKELDMKNAVIQLQILSFIYRSLGPLGNNEKVGLRGKELISELAKYCHMIIESKIIGHVPNNDLQMLIHTVNAHAFNCLCFLVISTQTDERFFVNLVLKPSSSLFSSIISEKMFSGFQEKLTSKKSRKVIFRGNSTNEPLHETTNNASERREIHVSSQFLSDSSLALDVNKLDVNTLYKIHVENVSVTNSSHRTRQNELILYLSEDDLNNHHCMEVFVILFKHMKNLGFISNTSSNTEPSWMKLIHDTFHNSSSCSDIKFFISKLILNCSDLFEPYAKFWICGLIDLVNSHSAMSQFVVSLISLIVKWSSSLNDSNSIMKTEKNKLLEFICRQCNSDNPALIQINMELFGMCLNAWGQTVDIPFNIIFDNLKNTERSSNAKVSYSIKLLALSFKHKFSFLPDRNDEVKERFITGLCLHLKHQSQDIFKPAFETSGLILSQHRDSNTDWIKKLQIELKSSLDVLYRRKKSDYVSALLLLWEGCQEIGDSEKTNLYSALPSLNDKDWCDALKILEISCRNEDNRVTLLTQLWTLQMFESIQFRSADVIKTILQLLRCFVTNVVNWQNDEDKRSLVLNCFEATIPCHQHDDKGVRAEFFQLSMSIAESFSDIFANDMLWQTLLMGIGDTDNDIAQSVRNFCSTPPRLPMHSFDRAVKILDLLFPKTANDKSNQCFKRDMILSLSTNLLLEMTSHSPDFIRPIFDYQLDPNVNFEALTADQISTQTSRSLLPHFVPENSVTKINPASTQDWTFKVPTAENIPLQSRNFDWLKLASSLILPNECNSERLFKLTSQWPSSQIPGTQSSFSFETSNDSVVATNADSDDRKKKKSPNKFSIEQRFLYATQTAQTSTYDKAEYYRRRTIEIQNAENKRQIAKRSFAECAIFLYRNYRSGKLPDIQIQNCSIITPLQMLAQCNELFARDLFPAVYNAILKECRSVMKPELFRSQCSRLSKSFNAILMSSKSEDQHIVAGCLSIAIDNSDNSNIALDSESICRSCKITRNEKLGVLLLEKYLISATPTIAAPEEYVPPVKKLFSDEDERRVLIITGLMQMYKSLDLNEEIIGLLSIAMRLTNNDKLSDFQKATEMDFREDFSGSFRLYDKLLKDSSLSVHKSRLDNEVLKVCQDGLINCLKKMCRWTDLDKFLSEENSPKTTDNYKSLFQSKLRMSIMKPDDNEKIMNELESLTLTNEDFEILLPQEMFLYKILKDDRRKAQQYCDLAYNQLLSDITQLSVSQEANIRFLQSSLVLFEMKEYSQTENESDFQTVINKWPKRIRSTEMESVEFFENLIFHRICYLDMWKRKFVDRRQLIDGYILDQNFQQIECFVSHKRTRSALNCLRYCWEKASQISSDKKLTWFLFYLKATLQATHQNYKILPSEDLLEVSRGLSSAVNKLIDFNKTNLSGLSSQIDVLATTGQTYWILSSIACQQPAEVETSIKTILKMGMQDSLLEKSMENFSTIIPLFRRLVDEDEQNKATNSLMIFSDFCDINFGFVGDPNVLLIDFVDTTLFSMERGNFSAQNKFPRVLQMILKSENNAKEAQEKFIDICSSIPSWMFISWIDQMIEHLFTNNSRIIESIMFRIADEFPHALFLPYHLESRDRQELTDSALRVKQTLSSLKLMHEFYEAIHGMTQPEEFVLSWLNEAEEHFRSRTMSDDVRQSLVQKYRGVCQKLFSDSEITSQSDCAQKFSQNFREKLVSYFKEDGRAILDISGSKFSSISSELRQLLEKYKSNSPNDSLQYYSPWLHSYSASGHANGTTSRSVQDWIEIPGQYCNLTSLPNPHKHSKIFKFDAKLKVMLSKQRPKVIKITGDDGHTYQFLIKAGEDLRQDFRLEQLFGVMNEILIRDPWLLKSLNSSNLIATYKVCAFSKQIGLIEWVDNTVTLQDFLERHLTSDECQTYKNEIIQFRRKFKTPDESWSSDNFQHVNDDFVSCQEKFRKMDLLRRSFIALARNHESFYQLRIKFIRQYAVTCAAHYILGIGDRHLGNFLINDNTGAVIGIDFGYAFGVASIFLPTPELVPFRLTASIVSLLQPSGVDGLFSQTLNSVLSQFSNNRTLIMSVLHVFISNQILDWKRLSRGVQQEQNLFSETRIDISLRKLLRGSPKEILLQELELKQAKSKWFGEFKTRFGQTTTSISNQTKELVDLATNSFCLARMFHGWKPYL